MLAVQVEHSLAPLDQYKSLTGGKIATSSKSEFMVASAYNAYKHTQQLDIPARETILAFFDSYCATNPLKHLVFAVDNLTVGLGGQLK